MTAERRRLATEAACTARSAEEARANLLDLKGRVADYEASAAAALQQTRQEEARATAVRAALREEQERLVAAQKELKVTCLCCRQKCSGVTTYKQLCDVTMD